MRLARDAALSVLFLSDWICGESFAARTTNHAAPSVRQDDTHSGVRFLRMTDECKVHPAPKNHARMIGLSG